MTYEVYFGTDSSPDSGEYQGDVSSRSWNPPGDLSESTHYYWQIKPKDANGTTSGPVWDFTTEASYETAYLEYWCSGGSFEWESNYHTLAGLCSNCGTVGSCADRDWNSCNWGLVNNGTPFVECYHSPSDDGNCNGILVSYTTDRIRVDVTADAEDTSVEVLIQLDGDEHVFTGRTSCYTYSTYWNWGNPTDRYEIRIGTNNTSSNKDLLVHRVRIEFEGWEVSGKQVFTGTAPFIAIEDNRENDD